MSDCCVIVFSKARMYCFRDVVMGKFLTVKILQLNFTQALDLEYVKKMLRYKAEPKYHTNLI